MLATVLLLLSTVLLLLAAFGLQSLGGALSTLHLGLAFGFGGLFAARLNL